MRGMRYLLPGLLLLVMACGSSDDPLAAPAPTQAVPATSVPATPVPPTRVAPTIESVSDVSAGEAILLGLGEQRPFPTAILNDAEPLPRDEVISHWTEYLGDTRVIDSQNVNMVDFCADGTGHFFTVTTQNFAQMVGESFDWEVLAAIGGRWNESKLRITPMDTSIVLANLSGNPYNESVLVAPLEERPAIGGRSADAFARVAYLPGILHPNEHDAVFTFSDSADTVCRG